MRVAHFLTESCGDRDSSASDSVEVSAPRRCAERSAGRTDQRARLARAQSPAVALTALEPCKRVPAGPPRAAHIEDPIPLVAPAPRPPFWTTRREASDTTHRRATTRRPESSDHNLLSSFCGGRYVVNDSLAAQICAEFWLPPRSAPVVGRLHQPLTLERIVTSIFSVSRLSDASPCFARRASWWMSCRARRRSKMGAL